MTELLIALAMLLGAGALLLNWFSGVIFEKAVADLRLHLKTHGQRLHDLEHAPNEHDALELRIDGVTEEWRKEATRLDRERLELDRDLDGFKTAIVTKAEAIGAQADCLGSEGNKLAGRVQALEERAQQWADFCAAFGKAWHAQPSKN